MNPIAILTAIEMAMAMIEKASDWIVAMKKSLDDTIPDDELRLESYEDTVARLKAAGKIPADYQPK